MVTIIIIFIAFGFHSLYHLSVVQTYKSGSCCASLAMTVNNHRGKDENKAFLRFSVFYEVSIAIMNDHLYTSDYYYSYEFVNYYYDYCYQFFINFIGSYVIQSLLVVLNRYNNRQLILCILKPSEILKLQLLISMLGEFQSDYIKFRNYK